MTFAGAARRAWPLAARVLGWKPADFWDSTPAELAGAFAENEGESGPERAEIVALMARFPDEKVVK